MSKVEKQQELYRGKAKTVYSTTDADLLVLEFRNDTSAQDGERIEQFADKGMINNQFNYFIMQTLAKAGIPTQMERLLSPTSALVKKLTMIPVECVIRNRAAGSLVKRLGIEEGQVLTPPLFDLFLKNDALHDPMVNDSYCLTFGWATEQQLAKMKQVSYQVNDCLTALFAKANLILVDFKLEFGLFHGELVLGDEFSPDNCRLWDKQSLEKLDKDRFRQNLGGVMEAYRQVAERLGIKFVQSVD